MPDPTLLAAIPSANIIAFPPDLGANGNTHVAQFNVMAYRKEGVSRFDIKELLRTIRLPLPVKLSNPDMLQYDEYSGGLLANLIAMNTGENGIKPLDSTGIAFAQHIQNKLSAGEADEAKLVMELAGTAINPRTSNVFKTPKARELQFEYSMVARTPEESDIINLIINLFRFHAYPNVSLDETLFTAPEIFVIRYLTVLGGGYAENPYLPKPLPCALVGMNVDENTYGDIAMFKGTFAPVERKLTLMFKELEIDNKITLLDRYDVLGGYQ
jgi:hypothetical protein